MRRLLTRCQNQSNLLANNRAILFGSATKLSSSHHQIYHHDHHTCTRSFHHGCSCCSGKDEKPLFVPRTTTKVITKKVTTDNPASSSPSSTTTTKTATVPYQAKSAPPPTQPSTEEFSEEIEDYEDDSERQRLSPNSSAFNTFVSNYYKINENDIQEFLSRKGLNYRVVMNEIIVKDCPFCHDTKGKITNLWKMYIHRHTGAYMCHRCGSKGSWFDFKMSFHSDTPVATMNANNNMSSSSSQQKTQANEPAKKLKPTKKEFDQFRANFDGSDFPEVAQYLEKVRGIKSEVAKAYGVGCAIFPFVKTAASINQRKGDEPEDENYDPDQLIRVNELCFTFPMFKPTRATESGATLARHKVRALQDKTCMKLDPPQTNNWGLFGWNLIAEHDKKTGDIKKPTPIGGSSTLLNDGSLGGKKDPKNEKRIILTEGEFDAMAVYQKTGIPAVSLPNGCRSLPVDVVQWLEDYDKIYLWMDDDVPGQQGAEVFAKKLGVGRCYIVHSSYKDEAEGESSEKKKYKDANEALLAGLDFHRLLEEAAPIQHDRILSFDMFKQQVYREFFDKTAQVNGVQSHFFPNLNKILKGHRRGELTIVTGSTGIGKTTVLSQLSLDYCKYGKVPTLWGSFEIRNHRLIKKMMCQLAGKDLSINHQYDKDQIKQEKLQAQVMQEEHEEPSFDESDGDVSMFDSSEADPMSLMASEEIEERPKPTKKPAKSAPKKTFTPKQYSPEELKRDFEIISEQFSELPMYFMNFYGSTDVDELLDAMDYAVYVYDVAHIVIDNLQFMMSTSDAASYGNRFEMQDRAIEKLRKFATTRSVHVTLVVHPKKIDEKEQLQISSVFGSAKATQEADNIIMIQRNKHYKYLQVKKNRFDGTLGVIPYRFERDKGERISELTDQEIEKVEKGELHIDYE